MILKVLPASVHLQSSTVASSSQKVRVRGHMYGHRNSKMAERRVDQTWWSFYLATNEKWHGCSWTRTWCWEHLIYQPCNLKLRKTCIGQTCKEL
jgi:hypothetical protein